jgi:protein TonB
LALTQQKSSPKVVAWLKNKLKSVSLMAIALWVSFWLHLLVLSIHFAPEIKKAANNLPMLDVVLVNAKTNTKPVKADVIAQSNLDRGGNTELDKQAKTSTPDLKLQKAEVTIKPTDKKKTGGKAAKKAAQDTKIEEHVQALEQQAQELLTQIKSDKKVDNTKVDSATSNEPQDGAEETPSKINLADAMASAVEMDRLQAQIAKQHEAYQKRPKRKELGARAQESRFAMYEDVCRQKIEKFGNLNYPEAMRDKKAQGKVLFSMDIKSDGSIEKIAIVRSSGNKIFDQAAENILRLAAPYPEFPPDIRKDYDIIGITRTMIFTREDTFEAQ